MVLREEIAIVTKHNKHDIIINLLSRFLRAISIWNNSYIVFVYKRMIFKYHGIGR